MLLLVRFLRCTLLVLRCSSCLSQYLELLSLGVRPKALRSRLRSMVPSTRSAKNTRPAREVHHYRLLFSGRELLVGWLCGRMAWQSARCLTQDRYGTRWTPSRLCGQTRRRGFYTWGIL